jgi:hypothetical protein
MRRSTNLIAFLGVDFYFIFLIRNWIRAMELYYLQFRVIFFIFLLFFFKIALWWQFCRDILLFLVYFLPFCFFSSIIVCFSLLYENTLFLLPYIILGILFLSLFWLLLRIHPSNWAFWKIMVLFMSKRWNFLNMLGWIRAFCFLYESVCIASSGGIKS